MRAMIPHLRRSPFIVVIGAEAEIALARLKINAASGGLRCINFTTNAFVGAREYAEIMQNTARSVGLPVLHAPSYHETRQVMAAQADLIVVAPAGVGNRVWLIPRDGEAFSVHLPEFDHWTCHRLTPLLINGSCRLDDEACACPMISFNTSPAGRAASDAWAAAISAPPAKPTLGMMH